MAGKPTARLVRRLPQHGWEATVLVPPDWAYFERDSTAFADIVRYARVEQTGLWLHPLHYLAMTQIRKQKSISGTDQRVSWSAIEEQVAQTRSRKLPAFASNLLRSGREALWDLLCIPDGCCGWIVPAYRHALRLVRQRQFDAILSVSPCVSAHLAALLLHRRHPELCWFAQFHDPWTQNPIYPRLLPGLSLLDRQLEAAVVRRCDRIVCATEEAAAQFAEAYDAGPRCLTLHNGFDPQDFPSVSRFERTDHRLTLTYTGCLYGQRDPSPLLDSLSRLIACGRLSVDRVRVCLIGDCAWAQGRSLQELARELGLESVVELIPPLPHAEALGRLAQSDILLLFAEGQPAQIPAKLFEYLHVGRPILAFCTGATERVVRETQAGQVVTSDRPDLIDAAILAFAVEHESGPITCNAVTDQIERYRADVLAGMLAQELTSARAERRSTHSTSHEQGFNGLPGTLPIEEFSSAGLRD